MTHPSSQISHEPIITQLKKWLVPVGDYPPELRLPKPNYIGGRTAATQNPPLTYPNQIVVTLRTRRRIRTSVRSISGRKEVTESDVDVEGSELTVVIPPGSIGHIMSDGSYFIAGVRIATPDGPRAQLTIRQDETMAITIMRGVVTPNTRRSSAGLGDYR